MTALREQIFAAIETRLGGITAPAIAEVARMPSGDASAFPALHIFDQGDTPAMEEEEAGTEAFVLQIGIDGYTKGASPHTEAHALYAAVKEALMTDPPLGGLAEEIRQGRLDMAVAERAKDHRLGFAVEFNILYRTRFGEPQELS